MPTIDAVKGVLVIRIVYDGPAFSGKTTSLKSLADGVASKLECPRERDGRTLFFDWMEYVGGLFEGRQISCQIVSVPGQHELAQRRALLLSGADAVVCVLDTRRHELEHGLSWLRDLAPHCRAEAPPVGIVVQANKRDADDAVPREELSRRVGEVAPIAIVESVATAADGIREAFVLAVRLALDRVRALSMEGRLPAGAPRERDAASLMEKLQRAEATAEPVVEPSPRRLPLDPFQLASAPEPVPAYEATSGEREEKPFVPDPLMPGGMIWPPVDGRALLHEVATLGIRPTRGARGCWVGSGAGWRFHSTARAVFVEPNSAREELIGWARLHTANAAQLSVGRAVILADAGHGLLRLWQLIRVESVLRERLDAALAAYTSAEVSDGIVEVANQLLTAREWFGRGSMPLQCSLWTVGAALSPRPLYVGMMPELGSVAPVEPEGKLLLERELLPHLRAMRRSRVDFAESQRALMTRAERSTADSPARMLAELVGSLD